MQPTKEQARNQNINNPSWAFTIHQDLWRAHQVRIDERMWDEFNMPISQMRDWGAKKGEGTDPTEDDYLWGGGQRCGGRNLVLLSTLRNYLPFFIIWCILSDKKIISFFYKKHLLKLTELVSDPGTPEPVYQPPSTQVLYRSAMWPYGCKKESVDHRMHVIALWEGAVGQSDHINYCSKEILESERRC